MTHDIPALIGEYGVAVVFANVLIDQIGLPLPAVPTLIVAGAFAADGKLSAVAAFAVALLACVVADAGWFVAGRFYGNPIMKTLCRVSLTPDSCVSQTEVMFERWGLKTLLVAKFIPGLALIAPPLAGATRAGWLAFLIYDALGAALWAGIALAGGMLLQPQIDSILAKLQQVGAAAVVAIVAVVISYIFYKAWKRRRFYRALRMARISVDELHRLMQARPPPLIVDVRSAVAQQREPKRIPGALSVPPDAVGHQLKTLPRDRDVVLYCTCPNEASAASAAKLLMDNGFNRVRPLLGGLDAWVAAGYTVEIVASTSDIAVRAAVEDVANLPH